MRAVMWIEPAVAILQHKKRGYLQQPEQVGVMLYIAVPNCLSPGDMRLLTSRRVDALRSPRCGVALCAGMRSMCMAQAWQMPAAYFDKGKHPELAHVSLIISPRLRCKLSG